MQQNSAILSVFEAESYIKSLRTIPLSDVGSKHWSHQSRLLTKINQQAHLDALTKHDEYIVDCTVLYDKLPVLVHELLTIDAYHTYVLPLLLPSLSLRQSLSLYLVLYSEATLVNLLEVLFYHRHVVEASAPFIVDIEEYCHRKIVALNTKYSDASHDSDDDSDSDDSAKTGAAAAQRYSRTIGFSCATCAVSILRYLTDHLERLPLSLTSRLLHDHDILLNIVPLILKSPFKRTAQAGKDKDKTQLVYEKFIDNKWLGVCGEDFRALGPNEIQMWLIVTNLLLTPQCRQSYQFNTLRQENLLRLRPLLTMELLDQLPLLVDVKRFIEELSIISPPAPSMSSIVIELVPEIQNKIMTAFGGKWQEIAELQLKSHMSETASGDSGISELMSVFDSYNEETLQSHMSVPQCAACKSEADKRCSLCQSVWYCGRECQVKHWKEHKTKCEELRREKERREKQTQDKVAQLNSDDPQSGSATDGLGRCTADDGEEAKQQFSSVGGHSASGARRTGPLIELIED